MPASALMNVMTAAARKAARSLARDFGEVEQLQVSLKGPSNFVSAADTRAEEILFDELSRARPGYGFLLEERGEVAGADASHRWIIDPLDGTTNFLHGLAHFAVSIGLERDGQPYAGVIYEPVHDEMFWAERGAGAYLNQRRLRVSARYRMGDAIFATGIPFMGRDGHHGRRAFLDRLDAVMAVSAGVRRWGTASLDLAYVAAGRFDGYSGQSFETLSEEPARRDTVLVKTQLIDPTDKNVELNYRMRQVGEDWKIIDVYLNGTVSELALRRSEYSSLIERDGFDALLIALNERIETLATPPADQAS